MTAVIGFRPNGEPAPRLADPTVPWRQVQLTTRPIGASAGESLPLSGRASSVCMEVRVSWSVPAEDGASATASARPSAADGDWDFELLTKVPGVNGQQVLSLTCWVGSGEDSSVERLTVDIAPVLSVEPGRAEPGDAVTVSAAGVGCDVPAGRPPQDDEGAPDVYLGGIVVAVAWRDPRAPLLSGTFVAPTGVAPGPQEVALSCPGGSTLAAAPLEILVPPPLTAVEPAPPEDGAGPPTPPAIPAAGGTISTRSTASTRAPTASARTSAGNPVPPQAPTSTTTQVAADPAARTPRVAAPPLARPPSVVAVAAERSPFAVVLSRPDQVLAQPAHLGLALCLAALALLLVAFPAHIFEGTLEENYDRVMAPVNAVRGRLGLGARRTRRTRRVPVVVTLLGFSTLVAVSTTYAGTSGTPGTDVGKVALTALGTFVAVALVLLAFELPAERSVRRGGGEPRAFGVLGGALVVAVLCAAVSHAAHFQPGYVYGLIAGFLVLRRPSHPANESLSGRAALYGALGVAVVGAVAFAAWPWVDRALAVPGGDSLPVLAVDACLATTVTVAVQALAFQLLPMRFLDGDALRRWAPWYYWPLWGAALVALFALTLSPRTSPEVVDPQVLVVLGLFLSFGIASCAFWAWFRWRPAPHPN